MKMLALAFALFVQPVFAEIYYRPVESCLAKINRALGDVSFEEVLSNDGPVFTVKYYRILPGTEVYGILGVAILDLELKKMQKIDQNLTDVSECRVRAARIVKETAKN